MSLPRARALHHPAAFVLMAVAAVAVIALAWRADAPVMVYCLGTFTIGAALGRVFAQRAHALLAGLLLLFAWCMVSFVTPPVERPLTLGELWTKLWGSVIAVLVLQDSDFPDQMQRARWEFVGVCVSGLALAVAGILAGNRLRPPRAARGARPVPEPVGTVP